MADSVGLLLIVVIQTVTFARRGTVYWTDGWLQVYLLFGGVPMVFVLPYFIRCFIPDDGADPSGAHGHLTRLHHDPDHRYGGLPAHPS